MSEYLILLYVDEQASAGMSDADRAELLERHGAFQQKHGEAIRGGDALQASATARTIHTGDGGVGVTDGPYAETKEILFSIYVIDVEDLDAAIAWAEKAPAVKYGSVEIRPMDRLELK